MALRDLRGGWLPQDYQKPPFHTYLNHILVLAPIECAGKLSAALSGKQLKLNEVRLLGSRLLVTALFLGTIALAYRISREAFGLFAARAIALFFASSAGFIEYTHFLSCDSPLLFFMLLALLCSWRIATAGRLSHYLLAGFVTGICTATKYNGLAVGVTIVLAHLLADRPVSLTSRFFAPRFWASLLMVPIGFVAGNPGAIFDRQKFVADYIYNSKVTPHYGGAMSGHGYVLFLERIPEIVGWPGAGFLLAAALLSLGVVILRRDFRSAPAIGFVLAAGVFLLYFTVIGSFPRMENRFVLPAVPFLILLAGPFLKVAAARGKWLSLLLVPILFYNCVCSIFVGHRFSTDPRTKAQGWIEKHAGKRLVIESSAESPRWALLASLQALEVHAANPDLRYFATTPVVDWRMPFAYGRLQLFNQVFQDDPWIRQNVAKYEIEADENLFTEAELLKRNPRLVAAYSSDYAVPNPAVRNYYAQLLGGKFPYTIAFDADTKEPPRWVYPREIDFLRGRITILKRRPAG